MSIRILLATLGCAALAGCGAATCGPSSCTGCCDATGACIIAVTDQACGQHGGACDSCASWQVCFSGACMQRGNGGFGGGNGNGNGNGAATSNGGSVGGSGASSVGGSSGTTVSDIGSSGSTGTTVSDVGSTSTTGTIGSDLGSTGTTASSATGTSGAGNGASSGTTGASHPPVISSVSASPTMITPDDSVTITALVTDADGAVDLQGGTLSDGVSTGSYGDFASVVGQANTFSITISFSQINAMSAVSTGPSGTSRSFDVAFYDLEGNAARASVTVQLGCATSGYGICDGYCTDLQSDPYNCGSCQAYAPVNGSCVNGTGVCPSNLTRCTSSLGNEVCADITQDSQFCGSCGNNCYDRLGQLGFPGYSDTSLCVNSTCEYDVESTTPTTCASFCSAHGTSSVSDKGCNGNNGTWAGCGVYFDSYNELCYNTEALDASTIPASTQSTCDTGSGGGGTGYFQAQWCHCR